MMQIPYFPGCTLTNKAKGLNDTAKLCAKVFDLELVELDKWYCCQANYSMVTDNLMNYLAAVRTLVSAREQGDKLVVLCSTCYYVLKRVNNLLEQDEEKRKVVFEFIEEEYKGPVEIVHFLELIRDEVGFDKLKEKTEGRLKDMAVAPYYGCQLLRPAKELAFDDQYAPTIFEDFLEALGARPVDHPFKTECCGSFLTTFSEQGVVNCSSRVVRYAGKNGAEAIAASCPLCNFNLDWSQGKVSTLDEGFKSMPVFYLTELMALSLGIDVAADIWDEHVVDPRGFLEEKGCLERASL